MAENDTALNAQELDRPELEQGEPAEEPHSETVEAEREIPEQHRPAIEWLQAEYPEWEFDVGTTTTMSDCDVSWWVARKEGHHPQAELSAGKLHTRLSEYLERQQRRRPQDN